ncbi:MAG: hypothetical protein BWY64_01219 [bacterium ADurb.Bin363]|nr:MAG: hypothetical protein BWY64_01219 [bacterium ADurb.Bin363]
MNAKWSIMEEFATRGRSINYYSLGMQLSNPDPVLKKMGKDIAIYKELLIEPHVGACVLSRKAGVQSLEWGIDRGKAQSAQSKIIEKVFNNLDIYRIISEILDGTSFGYQPLEILWEKINGLILPKDILGKPVDWFLFTQENKLRFKTKENYFDGEELPERKFLCPTYQASYNNPYGIPSLSKVFWPVTFKKGGLRFWSVFTEKYGMPFIVGEVPSVTSSDEKDNLAEILEGMIQDAVAVIPDNSSIKIMESASKSASAQIYKELINLCNDEISKAILGQTLTTQIGDTGSYAASQTHMKVRQDILDSDRRLVEKTLNQVIKWIYELNFSSSEMPVFSMWEEEDMDLELAQRDKVLMETGVKFTKNYYIKSYGLEEGDFDIAEQRQNTFPPAYFAEAAQGSNPLNELEKAVTDKELQQIAEDLLRPVIELVKNGNTYEDVLEALSEQYPLMDTRTMQDLFGKAMFISETNGRLSGITK